jgi:hypothetical protein
LGQSGFITAKVWSDCDMSAKSAQKLAYYLLVALTFYATLGI